MADILVHYGVLGMKWGVRRSPAELARARGERAPKTTKKKKTSFFSRKTVKKKTEKSPATASTKKETPSRKTPSEMTNDELQAAVRRLELEKRYRDLSPKKVSVGRKIVDSVIIPALTESGKNLLKDYTTKLGKQVLGLNNKNDSSTEKLRKDLENALKTLKEGSS